MSVLGIRTVVIYSRDVAESARFYEHLLGMARVFEHHGRIALRAGESRVLLHPTELDETDVGQARHGRVEVYFEVADVDTTLARLRDAGVPVLQAPVDEPWGERSAGVLDPDGYPVFLTTITAADASS